MSDPVQQWLPSTAGLPTPHSEAGRGVRERLLTAFAEDDHQRSWDALMRCAWEVEPHDRILAAWLPCLAGADELRQRGRPLSREGVLLRCARERLREEHGRLPPDVRPLWVVAATPTDDPLAHLVAAILSQRGRIARPWLWNSLPSNAPYVTAGARPPLGVDADLHSGHVTLRRHDVFWDVCTLVDSSPDLDLRRQGSARLTLKRTRT